ncbi:MAG: biotin transporter BioY [Rhodospirillales bacterium]|nr:biotin transporter BioY [Rhodospirillales bacterium]
MTAAVRHPTLVDAIWPSEERSFARSAILAVVGSALLWASAKAQVPMWPVPMTMQSCAILFIGFAYGSRLGAATVALYLFQGAIGLPVFAGTPEKGIGLAYMMGTTGGFLAGFLLVAALLGHLAERGWGRTLAGTAAAMAVGTVLLFVPGVAWLATFVGFEKAVAFGLTPFVAGAVVKAALAVALVGAARRMAEKPQ